MVKKIKSFLFENKTARQTIAKNTFWLTVSDIGGRLLRAFIIIYAARVLGAKGWGLFSYAVSLAGLITAFTDFGVGPLLTREAAKTGDPEEKARIISTSFFIKIALLAVGAAIILFAAPRFTKLADATALFPIIALVLIFDTLRGFGASVARALERMEWEAGFYLLTNGAIIFFGFLALRSYGSVAAFTWAYAAGTAAGAAAMFLKLRGYFSKLLQRFRWKSVAPILAAAWPFAISGLLGGLMINTDIQLIGYFSSASEVGFYSAADRIVQILYVLPTIFAGSTFPAFARFARRDNPLMRRVLERVTSAAFAIALPVALVGIATAPAIIRTIFGAAYLPASASLQILLGALLFNYPSVIFSNAVFAYDRQKDLVRFAALGGFSNLLLDLVLIPRFGITGSAVATFLAQFLANAYLWNRARQLVYFEILPHLKRMLVASIGTVIVALTLGMAGANLFVILGTAVIVYLGILIILREPLMKEIKLILEHVA